MGIVFLTRFFFEGGVFTGNTVFLSGKARLSEGITAEKIYGVLTVVCEVDLETGKIIDTDCTLSTDVAKNFFKRLVNGYSLKNGIDPLLEKLKQRYYGDVDRALGAALKNIYHDYQLLQKQ